ncbi:hypothetical protein PYV00_19285 [Novosphingobium sp. H3SJ31-1]|uniref:Uncharacterized protein n=2 Tax=Novosphingobium album (ex Liu et al. 2023) TaxID=3031130 RepID=A0ABT5WVB0_9SPHN|nr:hypothetical protein [Novosphingobium album (ex Liu et al. 2023)]
MTKQTDTTNRKPEFRLYHVAGEGEKALWTPMGAAWTHKDHLGFNINLDLLPRSGRLVMRAAPEGKDGNGGQQ